MNSSYVEGAKESRKAEAFGRSKTYVSGIIKGRTWASNRLGRVNQKT